MRPGAPLKTHCYRGHPLSGDNLRTHSRGKYTVRKCRTCEQQYEKKRDRMYNLEREARETQ